MGQCPPSRCPDVTDNFRAKNSRSVLCLSVIGKPVALWIEGKVKACSKCEHSRSKHLQETTKGIVTISLTFSRSCNSRVVDYFDPPCSSCCCKPLQREHSALQSLFHRVAFSEQYRSPLDLTACLKNKPASCLSKLLKQCFAFEEMTLLAEGASLFGSQVLSPSGRLDGSNEQFHKCKFGLRSNLRQV